MQKLGRQPAFIFRGIEVDKLADGADVFFVAVELLLVFPLSGPAETGAHRVDEYQIGDV